MEARRLRRTGAWISWGVGSLVALLAIAATPAGATGSYPGETLSLSQQRPSIAGQETNFVANGQQTDVNDYAGGFNLEVFAKDTSADPTCSPSYTGEQQASLGDAYEQQIVYGEWQGSGTTFSVPFKYTFPKTGQVILCAYSTWITDTAASSSLVVNIGSGESASKPVNTARPSIRRSGRTLTCVRGGWTDASSYSYAWLVNGRAKHGARKRKLAITKALKDRAVVCRVTASNSVGKTTASSRPKRVH